MKFVNIKFCKNGMNHYTFIAIIILSLQISFFVSTLILLRSIKRSQMKTKFCLEETKFNIPEMKFDALISCTNYLKDWQHGIYIFNSPRSYWKEIQLENLRQTKEISCLFWKWVPCMYANLFANAFCLCDKTCYTPKHVTTNGRTGGSSFFRTASFFSHILPFTLQLVLKPGQYFSRECISIPVSDWLSERVIYSQTKSQRYFF